MFSEKKQLEGCGSPIKKNNCIIERNLHVLFMPTTSDLDGYLPGFRTAKIEKFCQNNQKLVGFQNFYLQWKKRVPHKNYCENVQFLKITLIFAK